MKFWKRAAPEPVTQERDWVRRPPMHCAGCKRRAERYVYLQNGKDYCVACARTVRDSLGIRPSGRRHDDITDIDAA